MISAALCSGATIFRDEPPGFESSDDVADTSEAFEVYAGKLPTIYITWRQVDIFPNQRVDGFLVIVVSGSIARHDAGSGNHKFGAIDRFAMNSFRCFHAADIHLDSPLTGLASIEGRVAERIRSAPRAAFEAMIEAAIEAHVDFVVIAGDLYDGTWRDYKTGLFFAEQMGRLNQKGIPVIVLHGNHDAESQITKPLTLPENVRVFGARKAQTIHLRELNVALHGQSFRQKAVTENLVPGYPAPLGGAFNIGVLHTALGGMGEHAN